MNLVAQLLQVGQPLIALDRVVGTAALTLPGIVDVDESPAMIGQPG